MGIVWEAYHKGVPENPTEYGLKPSTRQILYFSFASKCPVGPMGIQQRFIKVNGRGQGHYLET